MTVSAFQTGTHTTTVDTTERSIITGGNGINLIGVFQLILDLNALADGDVLEVRARQLVLTAGTIRDEDPFIFYGSQLTDEKIWTSPPYSNELTDVNSLDFRVKQPFGTSRSIPYKVIRHA
jgi:hypothetical protein